MKQIILIIPVFFLSLLFVSPFATYASSGIKQTEIEEAENNKTENLTKPSKVEGEPEGDAEDERSETFSASQRSGEPVKGFNLMVAAYMLFWGVIMASLFMLWRKQRRMEDELTELRKFLVVEKKNCL